MKIILALLSKEIALYRNDRAAVFLTFIVPVVMTFFFGQIFGGKGGGASLQGVAVLFVDEADTETSRQLREAVAAEPVFRLLTGIEEAGGTTTKVTAGLARQRIREGKNKYALIVQTDPQGMLALRLRWLYDPRQQMEADLLEGLLQKAIFSQAPGLLIGNLQSMGKKTIGAEQQGQFTARLGGLVEQFYGVDRKAIDQFLSDPLAALPAGEGDPGEDQPARNLLDRVLPVEREQVVGQEIANPWITRSVGGWAVMFLYFGITAGATSLLEEKKAGLYVRLLSAPILRTHILWSKYLFFIGLGLCQLGFLFAAGWLLFGLNPLANFLPLFLVCFTTAAATAGLAMLLASVVKTPAQAQGISTMLILSASMLGGAMFPISFMPALIQKLALLSPVYWSMEGFLDVLWAHQGIFSIWPELAVLTGVAVLTIFLSARRFQQGDLFS